MKISYKGDYALKAMLDLALQYDTGVVPSRDMAARIDAPVKFLEQILALLKKGGFIKSKRGNVGGYSLTRAPKEIKLGDVVRHIDGPIEPIACVDSSYKECTDSGCCVFRDIWVEAHQATLGVIDLYTFADLVNKHNTSNNFLGYSI